MAAPKRITLGSGKIYAKEHVDGTVPDHATLCTDANELGYISGGATVELTQENYTAKDDFGRARKTVMTDEKAVLKTGVCTWNADTISKLWPTATVTEDKSTGIRTMKLGGTSNDDGKLYDICFAHEDAADGDKWVTMVAKNTAGITLSFAKDKETTVDVEFEAAPLDDEGHLVIYEEEDASIKA